MTGAALAGTPPGRHRMRGARGFRELLRAPGIIVAPGAYDAVSARLVETAGFQAVYIGSYATAASRLGLPDAGLVGMREMADHAASVVGAVRSEGHTAELQSRLHLVCR